ncbi:MAG: class I SAM-dependent methyltransferase [Candidatus Azobacteroides sp.]|nr:class I SAM-dependent methyltransferase [Candidatus Azobacteroides sp.]
MAKKQIEKCSVCGCTKFSEKFVCEDYFVSHEKFPVCICTSCSFNFTQQIPDSTEIEKYYKTEEYVSHSNTKKGIINTLYHQVRKRMLLRKASIAESYSSEGTLLDVGCGTGYFAVSMKERGWKVYGIEPATDAADFARNHFNLHIYPSLFTEEFTEKQFNIITLWHVLEHLPDPNESIKRLYNLLADNGTLIIAIPNVTSVDAKKYKKYWAAYDVPRHIWHFSPGTFKLLVGQHGFNVKEIIPMPFDAFYISMLSEKYKKELFPFIKGAFVGIWCYLICLFNKQKSSSLIYVLQKKEK